MVRKRKDQPVQAPSGRAYGDRRKLEESQRAVPVPRQPGPSPSVAPPRSMDGQASPVGGALQTLDGVAREAGGALPPPRPGRNTPSQDPRYAALQQADAQSRLVAALEAAAGTRFSPVGLGAPTTRPNEPVTAGLAVGPGPGPAPRRGLAQTLRQVAQRSGDPDIAYLASLVEQNGW